ncbi:Sedoheptulose 1,7-bisphosphatase [Lithohypha guttulata]|uniref:Sedoheptulose 1,7-bisphosphatase n=1 Tax=Lithohypha guttulata TaxID=1690604 RepID=UPI002DDE9D93|nr:Sedoheptulose 1,7-bisphosphatase [Lithohypha guttulata]
MTTPRCFIVRHGETEWSLSGKHTGSTDIPLTANGEKRVRATGKALVGDDRLIVPKQIKHIYVSPMHRAQRTLELLNLGCTLPYSTSNSQNPNPPPHIKAIVTVTPKIREWDYGDYEGITSSEIRSLRAQQSLPGTWDIWTDGCPNGESPSDVIKRVDELIHEIREEHHRPYMGSKEPDADGCTGDVVVVAHGHILRAFAMRWVRQDLSATALIMEAGGVGTLSYEHKRLEEPAILLGGGFVVGPDVLSEVDEEEREGKLK